MKNGASDLTQQVAELWEKGANCFVAGSAIFNTPHKDYASAIAAMRGAVD